MKSYFALTIALVSAASVFADHGTYEQWQQPWFTAIGTGATKANPNPTNGSWSDFGDAVSFTDGKMVLDQGDSESVTFTMTEATAGATNTIVEVKTKAMYYPALSVSNLTSVSALTGAEAKVAVAIAQDDNSVYGYYAWVKGQNAWTKLDGLDAPTLGEEVEVLIRINYRKSGTTSGNDAEMVSFVVGGDGGVGGTTSSTTFDVPSGFGNPTGVEVAGGGTIASIGGEVQYNVASIGEVGYATLNDAVTNTPTGVDCTISVDRATEESVNVGSSGVKIADNGNMSGTITAATDTQIDVAPTTTDITNQPAAGASGEYTFALKVSGTTNVVIDLPAEIAQYKEVRPDSVVVGSSSVTAILQTHSEILTNAVEGGCGVAVCDKLREFLLTADTTISNAYVAAEPSAENIKAALATNGDNGLVKWQDYVLGITPTTSVKPVTVPTGDTEVGCITLAIPAINTQKYSGDYNSIYYYVSDDDKGKNTDPSAIKCPLETGTYDIKIQFANDAQ